jgi:Fe-S cluster assembly protein SufB
MTSELARPATQVPATDVVADAIGRRYSAGFVTDIESESLPPGLDEDVVRAISARKNEPEWMTQWRLAAYRHWLTMTPPHWAKLEIAPIDFQAISYFSRPKNRPKSLDEVDPKLLETTKSSACRCTSARAWPALPSMRCSIRSRSARRSERNWPRPA